MIIWLDTGRLFDVSVGNNTHVAKVEAALSPIQYIVSNQGEKLNVWDYSPEFQAQPTFTYVHRFWDGSGQMHRVNLGSLDVFDANGNLQLPDGITGQPPALGIGCHIIEERS